MMKYYIANSYDKLFSKFSELNHNEKVSHYDTSKEKLMIYHKKSQAFDG